MTTCALPSTGEADASVAMRRGACPSLAAPMQTGDGLLVRLKPGDDSLTIPKIIALAAAAERFGNGIIEITARGNLQLRGLSPATVPDLAQAIGDAEITIAEGLAIEVPPLAGIDPAEIVDPRPIAMGLREALQGHQPPLKLAPKLSVVIDGSGRFELDGVVADVRLKALSTPVGVAWLLSLGGTAARGAVVGIFAGDEVVSALVAILEKLAALGAAARGRDLDPVEIREFCRCEPVGERLAAPTAPLAIPGIHALDDAGVVLGLGLAFAQVEASVLTSFLQQAQDLGANAIRLAPGHAFFVLGLTREAAAVAQSLASAHGFRLTEGDPRNAIATCAGSKGCASAWMETKGMAQRLVEMAPELLDGSLTVHLSGCAKGCARPRPSELTLVGAPSGYGLVVNGAANGLPSAYTDENGMESALARLGRLVRQNKDAGESAQSCLTRLGAARVSAAFEQG
ncbi:precorrin-3B synthase [Ensifer adhaerens]|uniref:precorrin-3B synthase n=1 Tax=Ensifer adhaerens TaxID=106592 RepID=UPI0023A949A7|nr:precorrin-3B synthase [Ensifer adhaerens]WDZ78983.1 precorrin-3B synthase [Ensifer adhaerens]